MTFFTYAPVAIATRRVLFLSLLRSLVAGLVLTVAGLGVVAAPAVIAHADTDTSSTFVQALDSRGITYGTRSAAVAAAHQVCNELDQGKQLSDVANDVMNATSLDGYHAGFFVGASIAAMCPRHTQ